jgi:serine protease Do
VEITAHAEVPIQGYPFGGGFGGFPGGFGGYGPYGSAPMEESVVDEGTGMIITSTGEVITNNHVIADAKSISVKVPGHSGTYSASVVGTDPTDDVALLQLHGISNLPTVTFGNSSHVVVGERVLAIGNALGLGGSPTVTSGIVSALGRTVSASDPVTGLHETLTNMIQTDAPINPGNSGGPLVNMKGHVIGMDTAAATSAGPGNGSAQDIGFAIPVNRIEHLLPLLRKGGTIGTPSSANSAVPTAA